MEQTIAQKIFEIYETSGPGAARQSAEYGYVASKDVNFEREIYFFQDGSTVICEGIVVIRPMRCSGVSSSS